MLNPQTHIILGNRAKAQILEKSIMLGYPSFVNTQTFITCQKEAQLDFCRLSDNVSNNYHFSHLITYQSKNSTLRVIDIILGGKYHRNETHYELSAPQAKIDSSTLILPKKEQHYDCVSYLAHVAKECRSSQLIKSIVENHAHSSFQGVILVKEQAQKTVATMKNDNLFLGNKGKIDAVPQLEIQTDDVQCHHGASISTLDDSSIFYLLARGLNEEESKKMLIFAFIEDILALLPHTIKVEIKTSICEHIQSMLVASMS
jgi:Fe-S cluster assembly protein SufD